MTPRRPAVRIRVRELPAGAGLQWIRRGLRAFLRQPGGFLGLFAMWLLTTIALSLPVAILAALVPALERHPVLVQLSGVVLLPLLSLGVMVATEAAMNDLRVRPHMLFAPLGAGAQARRGIGLIALAYFGALCLAWFAGDGLDAGEARAWITSRFAPQDLATLMQVKPLSDAGAAVLALKVALVALASVPLWHAPALVLWGGQPPLQALFSSVVALWRTRAAFAAYLLGGTAIVFAFSLVVDLLAVVTQGAAASLVVAMIGSWLMCAVFYVTLWFGFVDTFEMTPTGDADSGK